MGAVPLNTGVGGIPSDCVNGDAPESDRLSVWDAGSREKPDLADDMGFE